MAVNETRTAVSNMHGTRDGEQRPGDKRRSVSKPQGDTVSNSRGMMLFLPRPSSHHEHHQPAGIPRPRRHRIGIFQRLFSDLPTAVYASVKQPATTAVETRTSSARIRRTPACPSVSLDEPLYARNGNANMKHQRRSSNASCFENRNSCISRSCAYGASSACARVLI